MTTSTLRSRARYLGLAAGVCAVLAVNATAVQASASTPTVLRQASFDSMSLGAVKPAEFNKALGGTNPNTYYYDDMSVVSDPSHGRVVRTKLDAGTINGIPSNRNNGGVFFINLPRQVDNACISYHVRFSSGFDFSMGGKLPGLEGVASGVSASSPSGGNSSSSGWSGRLMWLGPKAYSWAGPSNMAVSYMYHPGQSNQYGDNVRWNTAFQAGKWTYVKTCYTMNTVGKANGVLRAWIDNKQVVNDTAFVYRTSNNVHVSHINWSIFRGGATLAWAGSRTGTVDIDNMLVTTS